MGGTVVREVGLGRFRPPVRLRGLELDNLTAREMVEHIAAERAAGRGGWVLTPNLHILRKFATEPAYADLVRRASIRVADGMPLIWASRLQRTPLPERIAGSELIWSVSARAAHEGWTVFFLGGNPGAAEGAAAKLTELHPSLKLAGTECPPMGFERDPAYLAALEARLAAAQPDVCYVGLPVGKQDELIARLRERFPGTWFLGIGISFSFVWGEVVQAPVWVRRVGLEWFHRLLQEPRRLARRYLLEGLPFAAWLLLGSLWLGVSRRERPARLSAKP